MHLAALPANERRTSAQLAEASGVSHGNAPTLTAGLSRAGILDCTRGPGGGCTLSRDPSKITMAEVVMAIEGSLEPERCAIDEERCVDRDFPCGIHEMWSGVVRGATSGLAELSLAEALKRNQTNRATRSRADELFGP